jgi:repressor of nif and glnA expression
MNQTDALARTPVYERADVGHASDGMSRGETTAAVMQVLRDIGRCLSARQVMDELRARGTLVRGPYAVRACLAELAKRGIISRHGLGRHTSYASK